MADPISNKTAKYIGVAASIAGIITVLLYFQNKGAIQRQQPKRRLVSQPRRDGTLGYPQGSRKFFGFFGTSSAQGAGAAAGPIPAISRLGTCQVQSPVGAQTSAGFKSNVNGSGSARTAPWRVRRYPQGTGPAY